MKSGMNIAGMKIAREAFNQLWWESKEEGFTALEHEIVYRGICSGCGLCAAVCPVDVIGFEEYPKLIGKCTNCGYCVMQCPRSFLRRGEIEEIRFGKKGEVLGVYGEIIAARTKNKEILAKAQDGGVATAVLEHLLKSKKIDGAVVSGVSTSQLWKPEPGIARSAEDAHAAMGSRYSTSPNLITLKDAKKSGLKKLAVVGTACHIDGIGKLSEFEIEEVELRDRIALSIAIFCKSTFHYNLITELVSKKADLASVKKFNIKGKDFIVQGTEELRIPLKDIEEYKRDGCKVCTDFTGRLSDISIGSAGAPEGYSTVIVRTEKGRKLIEEMKKQNLIETKKLKSEDIEKIISLATLKQEQSKKSIEKKRRAELPLPLKYLGD